MEEKKHVNLVNIADYLKIEKGDIILFSTDIVNLLYKEFEATKKRPEINTFIDSLIDKVGPEGTLLFPTFNWDFCHGTPFDIKKTKGKTGSLGNSCLKRGDFKRTKHALYSFAVTGKLKDYLCSLDFVDSFGPDSIFAILDKMHAKQILVDVKMNQCFTFVHYVEEMVEPPITYRFIKNFTGEYVDEQGQSSIKTYSMLVRDLDLFISHCYDPLEKGLLEEKLAEKIIINDIPFIVFPDLHNIVDYIKDDIVNNRSRKFCTYVGQ